MKRIETDITIIGGGMIGTAAACLFAQRGMKVCLVDDGAKSDGAHTQHVRRVSAISIASANLLKRLEVWQDVPPEMICPYTAMKVWDESSAANISFAAADIDQPNLGSIADNHALINTMRKKLEQNYQVTILDGSELVGVVNTESPVRVTLSTGELNTKLLIGADGAHSRVRELCDIATQFTDFAQDAIVSTLTTEHAHRATASQCFLTTGPVAMLPLADGRCSLVWSCQRDFADEVMALDDAQFRARLRNIFCDTLGDITACEPRQRFKLAQHHAEKYIANGVALVGDAAHSTHPLAGLGANLGFMDVAALAEVVAQAAADGFEPAQHSVLRRYERWRRGDNALVLAMMAGFNNLFGSANAMTVTARGGGMNFVNAVTPLKTVLAKYATGLYGDIPSVCRAV